MYGWDITPPTPPTPPAVGPPTAPLALITEGLCHVDSSAEAVFMSDFDIGCQRGKCFGGAWRVAAELVVQNAASVAQI